MSERKQVSGPAITRRCAVGLTLGAGLAMSPFAIRTHLASPQHQVGVLAAHMPPADDFGSPLDDSGYAHPEALVSVDWLKRRLNEPDLVLVGFMPPEEFESGRIPGSVHLNAPELEVIDTSDESIGQWQVSTQQLLGNLGITPESRVVVYDSGTLFSARLWWILHYFGHENVHILDGGFPAWQAIDGEVETGAASAIIGRANAIKPVADSMIDAAGGASIQTSAAAYEGAPNADILAQREEVLAMFEDPEVVVLDARTPEEFSEGHIPGAANLNFPLNAASEAPKFFKPAGELQAMYDEVGATADRLVIPYCASGVRSAVTAFVLYLLGYEYVALYTGSWLEWGEHPDTPKETGANPVGRPMVSSPYVL